MFNSEYMKISCIVVLNTTGVKSRIDINKNYLELYLNLDKTLSLTNNPLL